MNERVVISEDLKREREREKMGETGDSTLRDFPFIIIIIFLVNLINWKFLHNDNSRLH